MTLEIGAYPERTIHGHAGSVQPGSGTAFSLLPAQNATGCARLQPRQFPAKDWSLTSLKEKLIKIGAKVVSHGRYVALQMAEVAIHGKCSSRYCGSLRNCGRSRHQRRREAFDGYAFKSSRWEARENRQINPSATVRAARCAGSPVWLPKKLENRYYSRQFGSHLGNVG